MSYAVLAIIDAEDMLDQQIAVIGIVSTILQAKTLANAYTKRMEMETLVRDIRTGDIVYCSDTID